MSNRIAATIANGETTSGNIRIPENEQLVAVSILTDSFTGASFSFQISFDDGTTWLPVKAVGGASLYAVTADTVKAFFPIDPLVFFAAHSGYASLLRVVAASSQTGAKSLLLHFKQMN